MFLVHPIQVTPDVLTAGLFFKLPIRQRYVHSLDMTYTYELQQDVNWQLLEHMSIVLIFDWFRKFLTNFFIDKWYFSTDDWIIIREENCNAWTIINAFKYLLVISDSPPPTSVIMTHCGWKSICDSLLS